MVAFRVRLFLDFVAIGLVVACLAYWWRDNLSHEIFGTALFVLVIGHNVLNRRWYGKVAAARRDPVRIFNIVTIVSLALAMLVMLVTSLLISRDLFAFMAMDGVFAIREIHMFAGYWMLLIIAIHLGTRWKVVMSVAAGMTRIFAPTLPGTVVLRCTALAIALWGIKSSFEMAFGSKLMLTYTLDMWDFSDEAWGFFVNYASIVGLYATLTHYLLAIAGRLPRVKPR